MSGYIGNIPTPQATQTRETFTATASQTTFNTAGYTPGFVDVWLNGVKLVNGDDFTATNGSDVVLTVGAASGDTVEVLSFSTFEVNSQTFTGDTSAVNLNVTGTFTSRGIDDNADATAITIDSSENVLVGKAALGYNTSAGTELWSNGFSAFTRDNAVVSYFNRKTSDGDLVQFLKDGTTVGSIGNHGAAPAFRNVNEDGISVLTDDGLARLVSTNSAGIADNDGTLGTASYRWRDLYLSGGVYLGGTGAANKLDDYEEGTWTPALSFGGGTTGITYSSQAGTYTKIGDVVRISAYILLTNKGTSTGGVYFSGLPFNVAAGSPNYAALSFHLNGVSFNGFPNGWGVINTDQISLGQTADSGAHSTLTQANFTNSSGIIITGIYRTLA